MTEIDELEGKELAEAVATAIGMTKPVSSSGHAWFDTAGEMWTIADKDLGLRALYRPDLDITQAWELDGDGWRWEFGEREQYLSARVRTRYKIKFALVYWNDFSTKAHAYATARCRAFLEAMETE